MISKARKESKNKLASSYLMLAFKRMQKERIMHGFNHIESFTQYTQNILAASSCLQKILDLQVINCYKTFFYQANCRSPFNMQMNPDFLEKLQGSSALDNFFQRKSIASKLGSFLMLKFKQESQNSIKKKQLIKTQSLLIAYSENYFLGIQVLDKLHSRMISWCFR